jgi:hypothetical protein
LPPMIRALPGSGWIHSGTETDRDHGGGTGDEGDILSSGWGREVAFSPSRRPSLMRICAACLSLGLFCVWLEGAGDVPGDDGGRRPVVLPE